MPASDELAIAVRDVHVRYRVYAEHRFGARELITRGLRGRQTVEVHALKGVSFDVHVGEAVGILGPNGSGKSTLLRAVAGLQGKDSGNVLIRGEAHLLGVNAALKPALSGYRNVMLGGLAMGLSREEVASHMEHVVEFSGLGEAINRPMLTYSSGMRARLAFSIATLRAPDILLLDEALAVGDREFRTRSLQRIREIRDAAGAVLLVTHSLGEIHATCSRAIWLEDGVIHADGDAEEVIDMYEAANPYDDPEILARAKRLRRRHRPNPEQPAVEQPA
jgi:teichoic acid transport system ATP-binding protein